MPTFQLSRCTDGQASSETNGRKCGTKIRRHLTSPVHVAHIASWDDTRFYRSVISDAVLSEKNM